MVAAFPGTLVLEIEHAPRYALGAIDDRVGSEAKTVYEWQYDLMTERGYLSGASRAAALERLRVIVNAARRRGDSLEADLFHAALEHLTIDPPRSRQRR
jgi:hypothetical protein